MIANAVDLPGHPAITRVPAHELAPDSDLGERLVTTGVGALTVAEVARRWTAGWPKRRGCAGQGLIEAAALFLNGESACLRATLRRRLWEARRKAPACGFAVAFDPMLSHPAPQCRWADVAATLSRAGRGDGAAARMRRKSIQRGDACLNFRSARSRCLPRRSSTRAAPRRTSRGCGRRRWRW